METLATLRTKAMGMVRTEVEVAAFLDQKEAALGEGIGGANFPLVRPLEGMALSRKGRALW